MKRIKAWTAVLLVLSLCACAAESQALPEPTQNRENAEVAVEYGILGAQLIGNAPTGMTIYETTSILLEKGAELSGVTLTQPFLYEEEYSVVGPTDSEQRLQLQNGIQLSHNTAFCVLYGEILQSGNEFFVDEESVFATVYTLPASVAIPTYCRALDGNILQFDNPSQYKQAIEGEPEQFLGK